MPISAEKKKLYPANWAELRTEVLTRAGGLCECTGQCDSQHVQHWGSGSEARCCAPNGARIIRSMRDPARWRLEERIWNELVSRVGLDADARDELPDGDPLREWLGEPIRVVLTIAHLDHDPTHNDLQNLRALCQRCHLRLDHEQHCHNAARTRDRKSGQARLPWAV